MDPISQGGFGSCKSIFFEVNVLGNPGPWLEVQDYILEAFCLLWLFCLKAVPSISELSQLQFLLIAPY